MMKSPGPRMGPTEVSQWCQTRSRTSGDSMSDLPSFSKLLPAEGICTAFGMSLCSSRNWDVATLVWGVTGSEHGYLIDLGGVTVS